KERFLPVEAIQKQCAEQGLARVSDEPAESSANRNSIFTLDQEVRPKNGRDRPPPGARWEHQQRSHEDRVRRPIGGDRKSSRRQKKADLAAHVVTDCYEQRTRYWPSNQPRDRYNRLGTHLLRGGPFLGH